MCCRLCDGEEYIPHHTSIASWRGIQKSELIWTQKIWDFKLWLPSLLVTVQSECFEQKDREHSGQNNIALGKSHIFARHQTENLNIARHNIKQHEYCNIHAINSTWYSCWKQTQVLFLVSSRVMIHQHKF